MIVFDQLSLSEDRTKLDIECHINLDVAPNSYLKSIYLEYYRNRNVSGAPSNKSMLVWKEKFGVPPETSADIEVNQTESDFGTDTFIGGMFYVLVHWIDGDENEHYDIGVIVDWQWIYTIGMRVVSKFTVACHNGTCDVPDNLEQFILVIHSFQLAINAKDMDQMDKLWSRFIESVSGSYVSSTCNCQ